MSSPQTASSRQFYKNLGYSMHIQTRENLLQWFAVRTKSNREGAVALALSGKGFDVWCPRFSSSLNKSPLSGRPAFPGYVFCRLSVYDRLPVLTVPGVVNIVSSGRIPIPVDDSEIESLRVVLNSFLPVEPHAYLSAGDYVKIKEGPLAGVMGYIVHKDFDHIVVSLTLLQRSVSVAVQSHWLEKACPAAA